jgi:hypothetical protein
MRKNIVALFTAALIVVPVSNAFAAPPSNGCPRGAQLWNTATEPYQADNASDTNGDGWVCAVKLGNQTGTPPGGEPIQIYLFSDNDLPASR